MVREIDIVIIHPRIKLNKETNLFKESGMIESREFKIKAIPRKIVKIPVIH